MSGPVRPVYNRCAAPPVKAISTILCNLAVLEIYYAEVMSGICWEYSRPPGFTASWRKRPYCLPFKNNQNTSQFGKIKSKSGPA